MLCGLQLTLTFFFHSSWLSDKAHSLTKKGGDITLEPVANNGKYFFPVSPNEQYTSLCNSILVLRLT